MSPRVLVLAAAILVIASGATAYALRERHDYQRRQASTPQQPVATQQITGPRIVFRHTGLDQSYGLVAMVGLENPGGPREFTDLPCDRVYATATDATCLQTQRGVATKFRLLQVDQDWQIANSHPLAGIPSRTRISPDGSLLASTSFVTGHSYLQVGFSTATTIRSFDGTDYGNLESFELDLGAGPTQPRDRNIWGVTFADDDHTFYASVGTGGHTFLVQGDLKRQSLKGIRQNAECPSLSPDGRQIAYKVANGKHWTPAVLDLGTGRQVLLHGEQRSIDDQLEWLDDDTLLYGVPRSDERGVSDIWAIDITADAQPRLMIEQAWSPAVIRSSG